MKDDYLRFYEEHILIEYKITLIFENRYEIITYEKSLISFFFISKKKSEKLPEDLFVITFGTPVV